MAIFRALEFDGVNSLDYGIYITGEAVYNAPERIIEMIEIPGKNGALAIDQGYFENIEVTYRAGCFADSQYDFAEKVSEFRNALASRFTYKRLTDEYNIDEFRLGLYKSGLEVEAIERHRAGEFDIIFDCKPQRFLIDGDSPYNFISNYENLLDENSVQIANEDNIDIQGGTTLSSNIVNPTMFPSKPLISATGSGEIGIGNQIITITDIDDITAIYIDCESMEIYTASGGVVSGASSHVSFNGNDFPEIPVGASGFTYTTQTVEIIPRWWRI